VARQRFSRWPVTESRTGKVIGYLLAKDLVAVASAGTDWTTLLRPLRSVGLEDDIESSLLLMQAEGITVCLVGEPGRPLGLITLEDIQEQVFGRIEDEYPHDTGLTLADAVAAGAIVLGLAGRTREDLIAELAAAIPPGRLPPAAPVAALALQREAEISTDLGTGVAIPHARCPNLAEPLVAFGRSDEGVTFSPQSAEPVRLVFLLVTPLERPDVQLALLAQLANVAGDATARERLLRATTAQEVMEVLARPSG
jgi:mannitol/fructose-specific phosphotransferase system IIA component (Ntr-type)